MRRQAQAFPVGEAKNPPVLRCRARPPGRAAVAVGTSPEPSQKVRHWRHGQETVPYIRLPCAKGAFASTKGLFRRKGQGVLRDFRIDVLSLSLFQI